MHSSFYFGGEGEILNSLLRLRLQCAFIQLAFAQNIHFSQAKNGRVLIVAFPQNKAGARCAPALFWRRRRDSNSRTAFDGYTISSRAPSTGLGDFSMSLYAAFGQVRRLIYNTTKFLKNQVFFEKKFDYFSVFLFYIVTFLINAKNIDI